MINTIFEAILILMVGFMLVLIKMQDKAIEELENAMRDARADTTHLQAKIRVIEKRCMAKQEPTDKIEIVYVPDDKNAPKYGEF